MENTLNLESEDFGETNLELSKNSNLKLFQAHVKRMKELSGAKEHPENSLALLTKEIASLSAALKKTWRFNPFHPYLWENWGANYEISNEIESHLGGAFFYLLDIANLFELDIAMAIRSIPKYGKK